jgi:beta-phosphoglucomutase
MIDLKKLRAVIWDMDGVILDSEHIHFEALRETFKKNNILINEEVLGQSFGLTDRLVIESMTDGKLSERETERIRLEKDRLFLEMVSGQAEFLPGVKKWMTTFKKNGVLQALASSSADVSINQILSELDALPFFDAVVSGAKSPSKPDPFIFLKAAENLGVDPLSCLVIEDAVAGVQAAKGAGMWCVAVTTSNPEIKLGEADLVFDTLDEMMLDQILELFKD